MSPGTLIERIDRAVRLADFTEVYGNRVDASAVRQLYETKRRYSLSSTDAIRVPQPELDALVSHFDAAATADPADVRAVRVVVRAAAISSVMAWPRTGKLDIVFLARESRGHYL